MTENTKDLNLEEGQQVDGVDGQNEAHENIAEDNVEVIVEDNAEPTLEETIADLNDKLKRALAETENTRRRSVREREDAQKYAVTSFARNLLSVADNLSRALGHLDKNVNQDECADDLKTFITGVQMTASELQSAFDKAGVKKMAPMGEKFNHDQHQAMFEQEDADLDPSTVIQVAQDGYMLDDRLLRAAMVGISKKPA